MWRPPSPYGTNVPIRHPEDVLRQAHQTRVRPWHMEGREEVQGITIDTPGADPAHPGQDLDDALELRRQGDGYRLDVSIADTAALVARGTRIHTEAMRRVMTRYRTRPGNPRPMLPPILAEDRLSLRPGKPRLALTWGISLSPDLAIEDVTLRETIVTIRRKLLYAQADDILASGQDTEAQHLRELSLLAERLSQRRRMQILLAEEADIIECEHEPDGVFPLDRRFSAAERSVRECMVLTNTVAGSFVERNAIPALYRNCVIEPVTAQEAQANGATTVLKANYGTVNRGHAAMDGLPRTFASRRPSGGLRTSSSRNSSRHFSTKRRGPTARKSSISLRLT